MKLSARDRRDLEELAGIFLSPRDGALPARGEPPPETRPSLPLSLLVSLDDAGMPPPPLVRAAERAARVLSLPRPRPGAVHPLLRGGPAGRKEILPGPGVVPVPSRDGPALRWGLAATSRVLAWVPACPGLLGRLGDLLLVLREGCPAPEIGWIGAPDVPPAPVEAALAAWRARVPGARTPSLGTWRPGDDLPPAAREFLGTAPPARLFPPPGPSPHTPRQTK